jgi:hypothetical protein
MNTRLLIDAIVRQTTVLLAQLSTAAGIRAPLAHVADEIFVSLAREIEAQGVGRKVAADMFGLALRTYQKKIQRLTESATEHETTLWEAVLDHVVKAGSESRRDLLEAFAGDGEREVIGVLTDLVGGGLLHASGRGANAVYGVTSSAERRALLEASDAESLVAFVWAAIRAAPGTTVGAVAEALRVDESLVRDAARRLVADGRAQLDGDGDDATLRAEPLVIAIGSELGWEVAVLDHFRAVANAISAKIRNGQTRSLPDDIVGGTTLSFKLPSGHPLRDRVLGLLSRTRRDAIALWQEVETHNVAQGAADDEGERAWFYVGQFVETENSEDTS